MWKELHFTRKKPYLSWKKPDQIWNERIRIRIGPNLIYQEPYINEWNKPCFLWKKPIWYVKSPVSSSKFIFNMKRDLYNMENSKGSGVCDMCDTYRRIYVHPCWGEPVCRMSVVLVYMHAHADAHARTQSLTNKAHSTHRGRDDHPWRWRVYIEWRAAREPGWKWPRHRCLWCLCSHSTATRSRYTGYVCIMGIIHIS